MEDVRLSVIVNFVIKIATTRRFAGQGGWEQLCHTGWKQEADIKMLSNSTPEAGKFAM